MNGASPEGESVPHREPGEPFDVAGPRVEAVINDLERLDPGADLSGMSVEEIEDRAWAIANQAVGSRRQRDENHQRAEAWLSVLPFMRPNNSIIEIDRDKGGKPLGLKVLVRELPEK